MSDSDATRIIEAIAELRGEVKTLVEKVTKLECCPISADRLTFSVKHVIAIIAFLAALPAASGFATYYSLNSHHPQESSQK